MSICKVLRMCAALGLVGLVSGCALDTVKPWQRGDLARADMQWEAGLVREAEMRDHTYESKEAASLGPVLSGGGCGCN